MSDGEKRCVMSINGATASLMNIILDNNILADLSEFNLTGFLLR